MNVSNESRKMEKNYKNESIPDISFLITNIKKSYEQERKNIKYSFKEIYDENNGKFITKKKFKRNFALNSRTNQKYKNNNELSGLYIFFDKNNIPVYVGISRTIFRRMRQHFLSNKHNQSSLVYLIAKEQYAKENDEYYTGNRNNFPFKDYNQKIQSKMINEWKIQLIPEIDNYKIYLKEIYIACYEKIYWNTFVTH